MLECAFDIVTSGSGKALADAEVMVVGQKLVMELGGWENTRFSFRLSHWDLLTGILDHVGVDGEQGGSTGYRQGLEQQQQGPGGQ